MNINKFAFSKIFILALFFLFFFPLSAFSKGNGEKELKQAQYLVVTKHYSEALNLAIKMMNNFPDLRPEVDKITNEILDVYKTFSSEVGVATQKIKEEDEVEALKSLAKLNEIFPFPDSSIKNTITIVNKSFYRMSNKKKFKENMDLIANLLEEKRYFDAIAKYSELLSLYKVSFEKENYSDLQKDQIFSVISSVKKISLEAANSELEINSLSVAYNYLIERFAVEQDRNNFVSSLHFLKDQENREQALYELALKVREINNSIDSKNGEDPNDIYLYFVEKLVFGRDGKTEGILEAIKTPRMKVSLEVFDSIAIIATNSYNETHNFFDKNTSVEDFLVSAKRTTNYSLLALDILSTDVESEKVQKYISDVNIWLDFSRKESLASKFVINEKSVLVSISNSQNLDKISTNRSELYNIYSSTKKLISEWSKDYTDEVMNSRASSIRDSLNNLLVFTESVDVSLVASMMKYKLNIFEKNMNDVTSIYSKGFNLANGFSNNMSYKYPDLAIKEYETALRNIENTISDINFTLSQIDQDFLYIKNNSDIVSLMIKIQDVESNLSKSIFEINVSLVEARNNVLLATQLTKKGDGAYSLALSDKNRKDYESSKSSYEAALVNYGSSLNLQENKDVRAKYNTIPKLIAEVNQFVVAKVISDIDKKVAEGIDFYRNADFSKAIRDLEKAKEIWDFNFPGQTNYDIEYYLKNSRYSLNTLGGRFINSWDPVYGDVSGLCFSMEFNLFAISKLNKDSTEFKILVDKAEKGINDILTIVPDYQRARMLSLKLSEIKDGPDIFKANLIKQISKMVSLSKTLTDSNLIRSVYLSLLDYKSLDRYSEIIPKNLRDNVEKTLFDLEIKLGMREAPLSPVVIAKSNDLLKEAKTLGANKRDYFKYDKVINLLQQSLKLNHNNKEASNMLREFIALRGGSLVDLLTPEQYIKATEIYWDILNKNFHRAAMNLVPIIKIKPNNVALKSLKQAILYGLGIDTWKSLGGEL